MSLLEKKCVELERDRNALRQQLAEVVKGRDDCEAQARIARTERDSIMAEFDGFFPKNDNGVAIQPCPFCGQTDIRPMRSTALWKHDEGEYHSVVMCCMDCGARGRAFGHMSFRNEKVARMYWNDRQGLVFKERDTALARVAELEKDKNRLDWLETTDFELYPAKINGDGNACLGHFALDAISAPTVRECIDAAMRPTKEQP